RHLRPGVQGQPAAAPGAGRGGAAAGGPRRGDRRGRHRPRPAHGGGQGVRVGRRPPRHARAADGPVGGAGGVRPRLEPHRRADEPDARPAGRAGRPRPRPGTGRAGQPHPGGPGRPGHGGPDPAGQPQPQHPVRRHDPAGPGGGDLPAWPAHGAGREGDPVSPATAAGAARPAVLVLEDGRCFHGEAFGAVGETFGEAVFTTGMTGYQETLTDPSYHRQVVVQTAPHVGNTGVNDEDDESDRIRVAGYVVRDPARIAASWRATGTLSDRLAAEGVVGICGIDTRALTRHLRERGAMRAGISSLDPDPDRLLAKVLASPGMLGANLTAEVTTPTPYTVPAEGAHRYTVAALDLGIKRTVVRRLAARGVTSHVLPGWSTLEDVLAVRPDA